MGKLIVLEGIDGSGKTTLSDKLRVSYPDFKYYAEPGGASASVEMRRIVLNNNLSPASEALLYASARAQFIDTVLTKKLEKYNVILDRYFYSSLAYQGAGDGLSLRWLSEINRLDLIPEPDLLIILKPTFNTVSTIGDKDIIESRSNDYFERVSKYYDKLSTLPYAHTLRFDEGERGLLLNEAKGLINELMEDRNGQIHYSK